MEGCRDRARFSVVCSERTSGDGHKLKFRKCHLNIKKKTFLKWGCLKVDAGCPEGLWLAACLHPCSHSNLGKQLWLTLLGAQAGLDDTQRSLPACDSTALWKNTFLLFLYISEGAHSCEEQGTWFFGMCLEFPWRDNKWEWFAALLSQGIFS